MSAAIQAAGSHSGAEDAELRAVIGAAASRLPVAWPLADLIAVNPLAGVQDLGFEAAVAWGRRMLGLRGHLTLAQFREAFRDGRIERRDLVAALHRRLPQLTAEQGATDVLVADLLHGGDEQPGQRLPLGSAQWCDALLGTRLGAAVDHEVLKWCGAFCGSALASWRMPGRERGLFSAWRQMAPHDPGLRRLVCADAAARIPQDPDATIGWALDLLGTAPPERERELTEQLLRTPGFAAHFRWRTEHPQLLDHPGDIGELLAVRLAYEAPAVSRACAERGLPVRELRFLIERERERAHDGDAGEPGPDRQRERAERVARELGPGRPELSEISEALELLPEDQRAWVWLDAYEWHYRDILLAKLTAVSPEAAGSPTPGASAGATGSPARAADHPEVQAIFCIDTRSEGLRRQLERLRPGGWETYGMAGFFGLPVALRHLRSERATRLLPGPLAATATVIEAGSSAEGPVLASRLRARARAVALGSAKSSPVAPYSMAEAAGWPAAAGATLRTLWPRLQRRGESRRPPLELGSGLSPRERLDWAEATLRPIGLVDRFAPIVLIVGHTSLVENNAYRAALECGACGGHGGGDNARVAAAILNDPAVRDGLRERGLAIPESTRFVPAEHDTASDRVRLLDVEVTEDAGASSAAGSVPARVRSDLRTAGTALAEERRRLLPGAWRPSERGRDWAQVRPEWGLARNAAFIVAPGETVRGVDLECRTFLHSYDWRQDPDCAALEAILTAPGLVVQWINAQYYFSSVDPHVLGAGDKTLHNVIGDVGVLQGPGGDLRLGLPWQSVSSGGELFHEPMRVLFVVQAPLSGLDTLIARSELLSQYVNGSWITLVAREQPGEPWRVRDPGGGWSTWRPAAA